MESMSTTRHGAAILSSALIVPLVLHLLTLEEAPPSRRLILGVLSARDHFKEREAIRQTWGSALQRLSDVEMKFVLGDHDCPIHPADRTSAYGCEMWDLNQVLEYKFLRTRKNALTKWHQSSCPLVSAQFAIADKGSLMGHEEHRVRRAEEWRQHLANLQLKVEEEGRRHQDLLKLPHLDVYTNLPHKVMSFLSWTAYRQNGSYVMKVDDDTFVNVSLLNALAEVEEEEEHVWWSLFHHHRSVPTYGKWADLTYPSLTYPTFPAGAGYLMTRSLVRAVVDAQHHLAAHGGEDVSLGIWVSSSACQGIVSGGDLKADRGLKSLRSVL
ncbi:UDP-GalNAc:beta-1,3-N-acetylgalactosaminyltransferase 2 [Chionoecetes opilio]|uniref:Hexosyltransferase n=1 Tax=Chionoecetes opilio TaxID=41210 RepID=A0A8J4XM03_CHIOP|nr:UDP-GalNAc:beta-1,3-N-acetylgalactosaminyltransferase 2 [Chionoecetes opilio]